MDKSIVVVVGFLVVTLSVTGCLHGPAPEEVRDGFVEAAEDVESYSHEGQTEFEIQAGPGTPTQTTTVSQNVLVDVRNHELRANVTSKEDLRGESSEVKLTTYLVNGSVYDWTEASGEEPRWLKYDSQGDVEEEWRSRHELSFYRSLLEDSEVEQAESSGEVEGATALDVRLDEEDEIRVLESKFADDSGFFSDVEVEEFNMTVWIEDDSHRLRRVEADVSMTAQQSSDQGFSELQVDASFRDVFSGYDEAVEAELPEAAEDAQPVQRVSG